MIRKIISGGQSGVDRAALEFARRRGVPHGGWCPRGRWAEDGPIPKYYPLKETPDGDPVQRTEWNVRDSDATVIFSMGRTLTGGSKLTKQFARRYGRPCLHLSAERDKGRAAEELLRFITRHRVKKLNIAGPRASKEPRAAAFAGRVLGAVWNEHQKRLGRA